MTAYLTITIDCFEQRLLCTIFDGKRFSCVTRMIDTLVVVTHVPIFTCPECI